jgi:hypothetical protein
VRWAVVAAALSLVLAVVAGFRRYRRGGTVCVGCHVLVCVVGFAGSGFLFRSGDLLSDSVGGDVHGAGHPRIFTHLGHLYTLSVWSVDLLCGVVGLVS